MLSARGTGTRIKPASALRQSTCAVLEAFNTLEYDAHTLDLLRLKVVIEQDFLTRTLTKREQQPDRAWVIYV